MTSAPSLPRDSCAPYFTEFLAGKLRQPLLPNLQKLSVTFDIELLGKPRSIWMLAIKNGMLESVSPGNSDGCHCGPAPQCGFTLKPEIFSAIIAGKLSPQMAFFKREVEIDGNIVLGLKLATVLADFFKRFPWSAA
ncbi:MAG TPA: SCP2 sterol-binding domain-containing protein [Planctomycetota bacterium]|nr:SCP2 sterol-binding domain-containing protein [Planctomycetota bacterium]